jgi:hypothetical protein
LGYTYYGGIKVWKTKFGEKKSRSPVKTATSKPGWMLASDAVIEIQKGGWTWSPKGEPPPSGFSNLPAHRARNGLPEGGNEVFIDGHAEWIAASDMYSIHSWSPTARRLYFWQQDLGELQVFAAANKLDRVD